MRRVVVMALAGTLGLVVGGLGPVVLAACFLHYGYTWTQCVRSGIYHHLTIMASLGCLNGLFGAWDGSRSGRHRLWPVAWAPALVFVGWQFTGMGSISTLGICAAFVWLSGRLAQEVGVLGRRHAEPGVGADSR